MRHLKLRPNLKRFVWTLSAGLFFSGLLDFLLGRYFQIQTDFGLAPRPLQAQTLKVHGILGLGFIFLLGIVYSSHVRPGLKSKTPSFSGRLIWILFVALCVSVPLLYYVGRDEIKALVVEFHIYGGILATLLFIFHGLKGRQSRLKRLSD